MSPPDNKTTSKPGPRPAVKLGPLTVRAVAGVPGAYRWRAEWYPAGGNGRMMTQSLSKVRGERFSQEEAVARAAALISDGVHLDPVQRGTGALRPVETVTDLLELWLGHQQERIGVEIRPGTWESYRVACERICGTGGFGEVLLEQLSERELRRWLGRLRACYAGRTVKLTHNILTLAWSWGAQEGFCRPLPRVKPKLELRAQRMPSVDEVEATLEGMAPHAATGRCHEAMLAVRILLGTGARPGELSQADIAHVNLRAGLWTIRSSKTGERVVPLNADCVAVLEQVIAGREAGPLWDQSRPRIYQVWGKWVAKGCTLAGIEPWTLKGLRHLACTRMLASGIDVATAASITGHTPAVLLATYAHVLEHRRKAAVAALARPASVAPPVPPTDTEENS